MVPEVFSVTITTPEDDKEFCLKETGIWSLTDRRQAVIRRLQEFFNVSRAFELLKGIQNIFESQDLLTDGHEAALTRRSGHPASSSGPKKPTMIPVISTAVFFSSHSLQDYWTRRSLLRTFVSTVPAGRRVISVPHKGVSSTASRSTWRASTQLSSLVLLMQIRTRRVRPQALPYLYWLKLPRCASLEESLYRRFGSDGLDEGAPALRPIKAA